MQIGKLLVRLRLAGERQLREDDTIYGMYWTMVKATPKAAAASGCAADTHDVLVVTVHPEILVQI